MKATMRDRYMRWALALVLLGCSVDCAFGRGVVSPDVHADGEVTFVTKDGQRFSFEVTIEAGKVARLVKKLKPAGE